MAEFRLPPNSRIVKGITHAAPAGARQLRTVRIYRFNPDSGENPRLDTFALEVKSCGPMVLDALIQLKAAVDSSLTFRRSCREGICGSCAMNINGVNRLACTTAMADLAGDIKIYPLPHLPVIKDLVPDLTTFYAQYAAVKPWLQSRTPPPPDRERLQSKEEQERIDRPAAASERMMRKRASVSCGVSTAVGSSRISTWALRSSALRISTRCWVPTGMSSTTASGSTSRPYSTDRRRMLAAALRRS